MARIHHCLYSQILVYSEVTINQAYGIFGAADHNGTEGYPDPLHRVGSAEARAIFGLDATDLLLVFLVPFVAFWTARLALARGRSPWVWGGAAFILGIPWPGIDLPILGVAPVLFLMFFVRPAAQPTSGERNTCSRCASPHSPGQNYCTKCGWDLAREYSPENNDTVLASEMHQGQTSSTATMDRPADPPAPETATPPSATPESVYVPLRPESIPQETETVVTEVEAAQNEEETTVTEPGSPEPSEPEPQPEPAAETAPRPWGMPVPGPAPTAEGMTARGAVLLSEGKLQEAIDQFTKAIALDSRHREAFERRAQAYSRQGREDRAEEDLQQLRALNAES